MPRYDYRCAQCSHVFEIRRSMSDPEKVEVCPACQSTETARVYSAPYVAGTAQSDGCGSCSSGQCASCRHTH